MKVSNEIELKALRQLVSTMEATIGLKLNERNELAESINYDTNRMVQGAFSYIDYIQENSVKMAKLNAEIGVLEQMLNTHRTYLACLMEDEE